MCDPPRPVRRGNAPSKNWAREVAVSSRHSEEVQGRFNFFKRVSPDSGGSSCLEALNSTPNADANSDTQSCQVLVRGIKKREEQTVLIVSLRSANIY